MSYILDALTKSQQQRRQTGVPGLETPQLEAPGPGARAGLGSFWNAMLLAVAAAGVAYGIHAHFYSSSAARESAPAPSASLRAPEAARADPAAGITTSTAPQGAGVHTIAVPRARAANEWSPGDASPHTQAIPSQRPARAARTAPVAPTVRDTGARSSPRAHTREPRAARPPGARVPPPSQPLPLRTTPTQDPGVAPQQGPEDPLLALLPEPPRARPSPATEQLRQELAQLAKEELSLAPPAAPAPVPRVAPTAPPVANVPAPATRTPALHELPSDVRLGLGELKVNAHIYSDVAAERIGLHPDELAILKRQISVELVEWSPGDDGDTTFEDENLRDTTVGINGGTQVDINVPRRRLG